MQNTSLRRLYLSRTAITGEGLKHLKRARQALYLLDLSYTRVTNKDMQHLTPENMSDLSSLDLVGTAVTEDGIRTLIDPSADDIKLRRLYLSAQQISTELASQLRRKGVQITIIPTTPITHVPKHP